MEKPTDTSPPTSLENTTPLASFSSSTTRLYPGLVLADILRLQTLLGKGGMGQVWLATHLLLHEQRAVKLILASHASDAKVRERFIYGEARSTLKLNHPNIVRTYDLGQFKDMPYIVMEYVEGSDLKTALKSHQHFTPTQTGEILSQVAAALDSAHQQGLIHRDIKPANVLLTSGGMAKISDFGLVKELSGEGYDLTVSGYGLGTPLYMAPEQAQGEAGIASDIYSLGAMLYEMLTGHPPFSGSFHSLLIQHATAMPTSLHQLNPAITPVLSAVVMRALAKNPADRFTSATDLSQAYQFALRGMPIPATEVTGLNQYLTPSRPTPIAPPSGVHTFLFSDIEGSTKLWERYPEQMRLALARHDAIMRLAIENNGGYVFKMIGDAFHAVFTLPLNALKAAVQAQQDLAREEWPDEISAIKVRMALHQCHAENRNDDFVSPNLNRIARLMAVAYGGQVLLSKITAALVQEQLPEGVSLRDLGLKRLKDLLEPEQIYQLYGKGLPDDFPPLKTIDAIPHNLPVEVNQLIGREAELDQISTLLADQRVRLVTLTGVGGTGKTRLSLGVARNVLADFPDGLYFAALENVTERDTLVTELVTTLGLKETRGQTPLEQLKSYLGDKKCLLVLDNFEQLIERGATLLPELLKAASNLKLLITSRELLRLSVEREFQIEPLAVPQTDKVAPTVPTLAKYAAVALFVARAQLAKPDFNLNDENAQLIAEICRKLDGLPLAIELAAPRIRILSPAKLLERLSNRLKLLTDGFRDLPARQQTLRAAIDWSYDLLEPPEQLIFSRLAIFAGGCTLESVEAICNVNEDTGLDIIDGLEALVNKSLLKRSSNSSGEWRFSLLPTIREYGLEKLAGDEKAELADRHVAYFMQMAEESNAEIRSGKQIEALARFEAEYDNLRTALEWVIAQGESATALRLGAALGSFWETRGYYSQGRSYLARVLGLPGEPETLYRAKALNSAGRLAISQGDAATAQALCGESLAMGRIIGDKRHIANVLNSLGFIADKEGNYTEARQFYQESLTLNREVGDSRGTAMTLNNLGIIEAIQGDFGAARPLLEESLVNWREVGEKTGIIFPLFNLGSIASRQGDFEAARQFLEEALAISRETDFKRGIAIALNELGEVLAEQGDYTTARNFYKESLTAFQEIGDKHSILLVFSELVIWVSRLAQAAEEGTNLTKYWLEVPRLAGVVTEGVSKTGYALQPAKQNNYEAALELARTVLGEETYQTAFIEGQAMSLEKEVEYVLHNNTDFVKDIPLVNKIDT